MHLATHTAPVSKTSLWTSRVITTLLSLFMLFDIVTKVMQEAHVRQAMAQLGYPAHLTPVIGILELVCLVVYLIPRTATLGAILLTGYVGGAIASQLRIDASVIFPVVFGVLIWVALFLTNERLRTLIPLRKEI